MKTVRINKKRISLNNKTYFIADIAANHDGSLKRAKKLIRLCAKAGADAAKFQHFKAETIVSDFGFKKVKSKSHQSKWKKSVFQTYKDASVNFEWTKILKRQCDKYGIDFITSPYDSEYVDRVNKYICAYKIGSGDISWLEIIKRISLKKKPVILATGASTFEEVKKAVSIILKNNSNLVLMQCNTNYTNSENNFKFINLNVLKQYNKHYKSKIVLGLSDHTPGHTTVIGAIALGARVIEKHFTDNNKRIGPDHKFSMNFKTWKSMIEEARKLEKALGDGNKKIEKNEISTSVIQKRALYAKKKINKNEKFTENNLIALRPNLKIGISANKFNWLIGKKSKKIIKEGECIRKKNIK